VRGVAAAGLGKLLDSSVDAKVRNAAIDALERAKDKDPDAFVRSQAQKAFDAVKDLRQKPGPSTGPGTGPVASGGGLGGKTIYVEIGPFGDNSGAKDQKTVDMARRVVEKTLPKDFATKWPSGKSPSGTDLTKAGVRGFYIDGTVNKYEVKKAGANATVVCWVSMLVATFPEKSAFGFANNKKAEVDTGSSDKDVAEGKALCVEALIGGLVKDALVPTIKTRAP
jgi:hypothetical protein